MLSEARQVKETKLRRVSEGKWEGMEREGGHNGEKQNIRMCLRHICSRGEMPDSHQTPAE